MRVPFNVLWHFPGLGFITAVLFFLLGLVLSATVVLSPIGVGLLEYGKFLLAPCSRNMVRRKDVKGDYRSGTWRIWSTVLWVVYLPFGVLLSVLLVVNTSIFLVASIPTIVGIPVAAFQAYVIAESLGTALNPVGKKCVHYRVAEEAERERAREKLKTMRG